MKEIKWNHKKYLLNLKEHRKNKKKKRTDDTNKKKQDNGLKLNRIRNHIEHNWLNIPIKGRDWIFSKKARFHYMLPARKSH